MSDVLHSIVRDQLDDRRSKLSGLIDSSPKNSQLLQLLDQVDSAIEKLDNGTYGLCETCNESIEAEQLIANPVARYCLEHLTGDQQRALEQDLELASRIQAELLPAQNLTVAGYKTAYHYEGAGPVSGDYCDLLDFNGDLYFIVGDVSGKGVAASMLMAHLHASFRTLVALELPIEKLIERASSMFCESTLPTHFATLVCGKASASGEIRLCNAGHPPPLLVLGSKIETIDASGLPIGMFCNESFKFSEVRLDSGDSLFLYTDGLVEAPNKSGEEYGKERLMEVVRKKCSSPPDELVSLCLENLNAFQAGASRADDLTMMAIQRL
jgi:sigma-B regulation protein RsbU (phosphoserine phosphatase)